MKIISHRGYWEKPSQQNTLEALFLGLVYSDGIELDLRMYNRKIVVSHDSICSPEKILYFEDLIKLEKQLPNKLWALNIKEDGIAESLVKILKLYPSLNYFCFDMSFPETVKYIRHNLKIASRLSDLENENIFISEHSDFYLIDSFYKVNKPPVKFRKNLFLISSELHNKNYAINDMYDEETFNEIFLCTDKVSELC